MKRLLSLRGFRGPRGSGVKRSSDDGEFYLALLTAFWSVRRSSLVIILDYTLSGMLRPGLVWTGTMSVINLSISSRLLERGDGNESGKMR